MALPAGTKVRIENLTLNEEEGTRDRVTMFASPAAASDGLLDVMRWQKRRPGGMKYRISLVLSDMHLLSQETLVDTLHPVKLLPAPPISGQVPVSIENTTGAAINGVISGGAGSAIVALGSGTLQSTALLKGTATEAGYRIRLVLKEGRETTLTQAPIAYQNLEAFEDYRPHASLRESEYRVLPDGDPRVGSSIDAEVAKSPSGLPGGQRNALHIRYTFEKGWKFFRLAPVGRKHAAMDGEPAAIGMWVYGDGSGDILNLRYVDASGQTFQTSAGEIRWQGWKWVSFSLEPKSASYWGGNNDGKITYPISIDTAALVDSPGGRGGKGEIWLTDLTLLSH